MRARVRTDAADHRHRLRLLRRADHRHARLDDPGLLERDQREGVAQQLDVVVAQRCDRADRGMHHVGGIQPAAQAHLQHGPLDAVFGEVLERQRGHDLEGRDLRDGFDGRLAAIEQRHQLGLGHQPAAQPDALAEGVEVGRSVEPGAVTGRAQDRLHHRRRRAFALGAGDMDAPEAVLRPAQPFQHLFHAAQVEGHGVVGVANLLLVVDVTENVIQGILVKAHICSVA